MTQVHVVPHIEAEASGVRSVLLPLCQHLAARGHDVEISCLAAEGQIPGVRLDLHPEWPVLRRFAISPSHARRLRSVAGRVDIIHNHGAWSMVNVAAGLVVPGRRAKLVTSPHGMMTPWALRQHRTFKRLGWLLQQRAFTRADLLHASSAEERDELRGLGLKAPIAVIPHGIDVPALPAHQAAKAGRTLLFLSRIHPKKGIDRLLHAWRQLESTHPDWRLVIAGGGESAHEREAQELAVGLGVQRVEFPGPLYGEAKTSAYLSADLFVLPTHSENFGVVVAEALAHGCPAIVSHGAPWSGLEREGCGWWVENDADALDATLRQAMSKSTRDLAEMGRLGRAWMQRDFSWPSIAGRVETAYRWILSDGGRPDWIFG